MLGNVDAYEPFPILHDAIKAFPYAAREDGACEMLNGNQCSIYEDRPLLCNVKKLGEMHGGDTREWYALNAISCNILIKEAGLPDSYLVRI